MLKFVIFACAFVACIAVPPPPEAKPQPAAKPEPAAKPQPVATPQGPAPHGSPLPSPPVQAPESTQVYCGETPNAVYKCLGNPKLLNASVAAKCRKHLSECDRVKCIFRGSGWSTAFSTTDDTVNKQKVAEYFSQYAVENPAWSAAVQHLKVACLDKDLPAQGPTQNCAAYDVLHCIIISFLRNASPTQWHNTPDCMYPRAFASACPICPDSCFVSQVPYGTCNACISLPRTP